MSNFIFYRGPSMLDGSPIVGICQIKSRNKKVGALVQTFIIRDDMSPVTASRTGADKAVCGSCPHMGQHDPETGLRIDGTRTCYVMLFPIEAKYRTLKAGKYTTLPVEQIADRIAGKVVRLGAYGDPAAIPHAVWTVLLRRAAAHTGYTHQWRMYPEFADIVMASADSSADRVAAKMLGFRIFRVAPHVGWIREAGEVLCPASAEAGRKTTCALCRACGGTSAKARADIVIPAHGSGKRRVRG